jgi:hypothetical protein
MNEILSKNKKEERKEFKNWRLYRRRHEIQREYSLNSSLNKAIESLRVALILIKCWVSRS